ncbi:hypothetical protein FOIG_11938 [Fusarium odoratissimum NRRL 54006]|uniref:Uncharacterized protein n=2 Tax=Fusarium oxysporum species complex TaxID=171631 RepID=X0J2Q2_FUSO5|nr:uncharacterized protein FOIG_11938 [Fusarium odoratissimum NRRL 54006]EXL95402.1 hypothetical protein FOIG_11938 [Fusarium odoratissimum NRRL 54006]TXC06069.1 hypothetical protein FocTR4_00010633 [Fusarium oxysporum f. sp. cubense]
MSDELSHSFIKVRIAALQLLVRSKNPDAFHIARHLTNRVTTFVDPSGSLRLAKRRLVRARR